jgi:hypothetical protein
LPYKPLLVLSQCRLSAAAFRDIYQGDQDMGLLPQMVMDSYALNPDRDLDVVSPHEIHFEDCLAPVLISSRIWRRTIG